MKKLVLSLFFTFCFTLNARALEMLDKDIAETTIQEAYDLITKDKSSADEFYRGFEFIGFSRGAIYAYRRHAETEEQFKCLNKTPLDVDDIIFGRYKEGKISGKNIYIDEIINILNECIEK